MKTQRFFIVQNISESKKVSVSEAALIHQWWNVFKIKTGDEIVLFDGSGFEYRAKFLVLEKNKAELEILNKVKNEVGPKREVILYQSLIEKDNFEWIVQKGAKLGVAEFAPVISERSEKKL